MLNHIVLIGRLTKDPESQYTPSGIALAKFSIAVDRPTKNPETGERETDFFDIVAWRRTAEFVTQYMTKGRLVAVEGRLQIRSWIAQDGTKRKAAEIIADNVQGLDRPKEAEGGAPMGEVEEPGLAPAAAVASSAPRKTPAPPAAEEDSDETDPFADE
jgi:single-strand DNA-binding protein